MIPTCQLKITYEITQLTQKTQHRTTLVTFQSETRVQTPTPHHTRLPWVCKQHPQAQVQLILMVKLLFRTPQEVQPVQMVLQVQVAMDIHNHPTKDRVRRTPSTILIIHNLPLQVYLHIPARIPRAEI